MKRVGFLMTIVACTLGPSGAAAQAPLPSFEPLPVTSMLTEDQYARDYWEKDRDRAVGEIVRNVEHFHMGPDNFWMEYEAGKLDGARTELDFVLRYVPNHPRGLYLMGLLSRKLNDEGYALRYYERAVHLFPQHPYTLAQYGHYLTEIGSLGLGVRYLKEALRADSKLTDAQAWLAEAEQRLPRDAP